MVQYRVDIDGTTFDELNQVIGSTTINPFGDRFVCEFLDNEGNKFDNVSPDNAAEVFARDPTPANQADNSFSSIFEGYVVQADEGQEGSRDSLSVTIYSFDQIIRNERVSNDQSGNTIATALENIIKTDTPVEYVSGNVSVGDNRTLNRPLQGLTVEEALRVLSLRSENENYGVNDSRKFFFRQRVESSGQKDITDSDVTNYSVPERGKESKNEVTVNYNSDNDRVTVSNGSNQLNLQDSLNTQDPVGFPDEISRPTITDDQEALAEGREFLRQRENTLAGRVTVVGDTDFLSNDVGDTINVTITPRGIDDEFVLVGKEVDYIRNEISFDIIQKRGDQDSLLKAIGQQLKREELSGTDQGTPSDKVTQTSVRVDIEQTYSGVNVQSAKVTTTCRNKLREAWLDDASVELDRVVFGDTQNISRATTQINQSGTTSNSYNGSAYNTTNYNAGNTYNFTTAKSGTYNQSSYNTTGYNNLGLDESQLQVTFDLEGDIDVIGLEDVDGDLLFVSRLESTTTDPSGTLTITINDGETDKSVLTNVGQKAIRDLFIGDTSDLPQRGEYGDNNTNPQVTDKNISTQVSKLYEDEIIQSANTNTEWQNNTSLISTDRIFIENGFLKLAQSAYVEEAENANPVQTITDNRASGGEAALDSNGTANEVISTTFTTDYDIPSGDWGIAVRTAKDTNTGFANIFDIVVDGNTLDSVTLGASTDFAWIDRDGGFDLSAGNHLVEFEISTQQDDQVIFDVFALYDNTLTYNFDNIDLSTVSRDYLNGPELYPAAASIDVDTQEAEQVVDEITLETDFNNTENGQFVEVGDGTTKRNDNSENVTVKFDTPTTTLNATLGLDGYGTGGSQTPRERFNGQTVDVADLLIDLAVLNKSDVGRADYEVIFGSSDVNGLTLTEAGQVNSNGDALTRSIFPEINPSGESVILSEDLGFDLS